MAGFSKPRDPKGVIDYAVLPYRALGFALTGKLWRQFLVTEIEELGSKDLDGTFNEDLIFSEGTNDRNKMVVRDLIMNHANQSFEHMTDSTHGRGQGLVLLLHGMFFPMSIMT